LAAGGIIDADGAQEALDAGAIAAVAGTLFLLSEESRAHPGYKQRCLDARETILTELLGLGWPDAPFDRSPTKRRAVGCATTPADLVGSASRTASAHPSRAGSLTRYKTARSIPAPDPTFLGPQPPTDDGPANLLDSGPLYAGAPSCADDRYVIERISLARRLAWGEHAD
jgi:hypothetical protein